MKLELLKPLALPGAVGAVVAVLIIASPPLIILGELAGRGDYRIMLALVFLALVILAACSKTKGFWSGVCGGFVFGIPIVLACLAVPVVYSEPTHDHAAEFRDVIKVTLAASTLLLGICGSARAGPRLEP
jgi:hypothetical protein